MAAIDCYFHVGSRCIQGGEVGVKPVTNYNLASATGHLAGFALMHQELQRVVPSGPDFVNGANYFPLWDPTYNGIANNINATAGGASTITSSTAQWKVDHYIGKTLTITAGTGSGQTRTVASNTATVATVTVPWGVVPDATSVFNFGPGAWVNYHYIPNTLIPGAGGDSFEEGTASITPTAMLMQRLFQQYQNQAPGFRFIKYATTSNMTGYIAGAVVWDAFMARYNFAKGIEEGKGNTLVPKAFIIDCADEDIFSNNLTFITDLPAMIDNVRATLGTQCLIVIVQPHALTGRTTYPASASFVRDYIRSVVDARRLLGQAVTLYDMNWGAFTWNFAQPVIGELPADPHYFDLPTVLVSGVGLYNVIQAHYTEIPAIAQTKALPAVAIISDSQFHGLGISPLMALYANQPSLLGPGPTGSVKNNVWIWDDAAQQLVLYDVTANSNTYGGIGGMGPDVSLPRKLIAERYPQGVVMFKYAKGGVALTPEAVTAGATGFLEANGTLWADIEDKWTRCRISALQTLNRSLDTIGLCVSLGENDAGAGNGATTAFEARAGNWVDDARETFATRVDGTLPVVWMQGPPHINVVPGGSTLGLAEFRTRYRAAVAALETSKTKLKYVRNTGPTGPDGYELSRDNVHYGGETLLRIGDKMAELLLEIIASESAVEGAGDGGGTDEGTDGGTDGGELDGPSGSELVVEDGSGLSNADSYQSLEEIENRIALRGNVPAAWTSATVAQKNDWCRDATIMGIDLMFGQFWSGYRTDEDQSLDWPRIGAGDSRTGRPIRFDVVPEAVKWMQVEFVRSLAAGIDPLANLSPDGDAARFATSTSDSLPGGFNESRTYDGSSRPVLPVLTRLRMLAMPLLVDTDSVGLA